MSDRATLAYQRRGGDMRSNVIQTLVQQTSSLDPDLWTVMDQRDNTLIEEEILHGAGSSKYVYSFPIAGSGTVSGISVIGARELAAAYGGLKANLISSISKIGTLLQMKSYPFEGSRMQIFTEKIPELWEEKDYYEVYMVVRDVKTGNDYPVEKKEFRFEERSAATLAANPDLAREFVRPHYQIIAQSKAWRNGVLSLIPQHVQLEWKEQMLKLGKAEVITGSMIDEKRSGVLRYAASKAIGLDRRAVEALTFDQIAGLADAVKEGRTEQFTEAAGSLGLIIGETTQVSVNKVTTVAAKTGNVIGQAGKIESQAKKAATADDKAMAIEPRDETGEALPVVNAAAFAEWFASRLFTTKAADDLLRHNEKNIRDASTQPEAAAKINDAKGRLAKRIEEDTRVAEKAAAAKKDAPKTDKPPIQAKQQATVQEVVTQAEQQDNSGGFDHYPVDEHGDPIEMFEGGEYLNFRSPMEFVLWFVERARDSVNVDALKENNEDALKEARADPGAQSVLEAWDDHRRRPPADDPPLVVETEPSPANTWLPVKLENFPNRKPNWAKYATDVAMDLKEQVNTREDLEQWIAANGPTYVGKAYQVKIEGLIAARVSAAKLEPEGMVDRDTEQANSLIADLNKLVYQHDYDALLANAALRSWAKRMTEQRPDLRAAIQVADQAAQDRIKARSSTANPDPGGSAPAPSDEQPPPHPGEHV